MTKKQMSLNNYFKKGERPINETMRHCSNKKKATFKRKY